jgi:hypothetical protein
MTFRHTATTTRIFALTDGLAALAAAFVLAVLGIVAKTGALPELATLLTAAVATLSLGILFGVIDRIQRSVKSTRVARRTRGGYADRLAALTERLRSTSNDVDAILAEMSAVATERAAAVTKLESDLSELVLQEQRLQHRVAALGTVSIPAAEHFATLAGESERRSARRDYLLFVLGVLLSTLVSIIFFVLQK